MTITRRVARRAQLYRIAFPGPGELSVWSRPDASSLTRAVRRLRRQGVTTVVSTLTSAEIERYDLDGEAATCREAGIDFFWWPIVEFGVPDDEAVADDVVARLHDRLTAGEHVAVHCRLALGRSPMVASALLVESGVSATDAVWAVSHARGRPVPTHALQRGWLRRRATAAEVA